jgi:hypothetical protein
MARKEMGSERKYFLCAAVTGIITVLKSVARIRLVTTENTSVCVTVNCKLCR